MNEREKFGAKADATVGEVKVYFQKLTHLHPDHGGEVTNWVRMYESYRNALKEASICPHCKNTKKIKHTSGFSTIELLCPHCK